VRRASPATADRIAADPVVPPTPLPIPADDLAARLVAGAAALGLDLSAAQQTRLLGYLGLLSRWGRVYNLTAVREPAQMLTQHVLDSLAVWPALRRRLEMTPSRAPAHAAAAPAAIGACASAAPARRLLDVGSGAGLPGVVLAIVAPDLEVSCVDAVGKKAGFVRQVAAELGLHNLRAEHARVESLPAGREAGGFDVVTSRAFASLADFVDASQAQLAPAGVWMAMKGQVPDLEIAALPAQVEVFHVEQLAVPGLQAQRCLVWMRRRG
jgi:16S rRNA (guanine527-N7)-methyltransferase